MRCAPNCSVVGFCLACEAQTCVNGNIRNLVLEVARSHFADLVVWARQVSAPDDNVDGMG